MGKPNSTDCLTLNVTSGQWERGTFSNGPLEDSVRGVVHIENKGVFLVHTNGISFLAQNSVFWVAGNLFSEPAVCGCNVSSTNFVTIHMTDSQNILGYSVTGSEAKQEPTDTWPNLLTKRHGPGCGATQYHLIVAGGVSGWDEVLNSVEIVNIGNKGLRRGGNLKQARAYFQMIPVGSTFTRILAIGGRGVHSASASSEWWDSEENSWEEGPSLSTERSTFSAIMAFPDLVCSKIDPPGHSCPIISDTSQTCIFSSALSGNYNYALVRLAVRHAKRTSLHSLSKSRFLHQNEVGSCSLKGILHQKIFYRLNLIFWIVMGCGIARFGRKGLKTTET